MAHDASRPPPSPWTPPAALTRALRGDQTPLLACQRVTVRYGAITGCEAVDLSLWPGEVVGIVGESGSGKSTFLRAVAGLEVPSAGHIWLHTAHDGAQVDIARLPEAQRRALKDRSIGLVHQRAEAGLRLHLSAGGNIVEPLLALGLRHYGQARATAMDWLARVEVDTARLDDPPVTFSGGMRQRVQLARVLAPHPRLVLLDEPTTGLDVSVQARLVDLIRRLVRELHLSVILVTHDLGIARTLADRLLVMRGGHVVERGITDQVLDDPQHPYTQLLVSSVVRM